MPQKVTSVSELYFAIKSYFKLRLEQITELNTIIIQNKKKISLYNDFIENF